MNQQQYYNQTVFPHNWPLQIASNSNQYSQQFIPTKPNYFNDLNQQNDHQNMKAQMVSQNIPPKTNTQNCARQYSNYVANSCVNTPKATARLNSYKAGKQECPTRLEIRTNNTKSQRTNGFDKERNIDDFVNNKEESLIDLSDDKENDDKENDDKESDDKEESEWVYVGPKRVRESGVTANHGTKYVNKKPK